MQLDQCLYMVFLNYKNMYRTNFNALPSKGEYNKQPSMTILGESYTIPELIRKFSNGQSVPIQRQPIYLDDPTFDTPDFKEITNFDLVDRDILQSSNREVITELYEKAKKSSTPTTIPMVSAAHGGDEDQTKT